MSERLISFFLKNSQDPLWSLQDTAVPEVSDSIGIEAFDGSLRIYKVIHRTWMTAKQGSHSFDSIRLTVEPDDLA